MKIMKLRNTFKNGFETELIETFDEYYNIRVA